ncbi:MAG: hypothetical protein Q8K32_09240 [Archangium sp.]|nr:hypothetical protein [Archangium sp.]
MSAAAKKDAKHKRLQRIRKKVFAGESLSPAEALVLWRILEAVAIECALAKRSHDTLNEILAERL